jgi:hypothetical protein
MSMMSDSKVFEWVFEGDLSVEITLISESSSSGAASEHNPVVLGPAFLEASFADVVLVLFVGIGDGGASATSVLFLVCILSRIQA